MSEEQKTLGIERTCTWCREEPRWASLGLRMCEKDRSRGYTVRCRACRAETEEFSKPQEAVEAWNKGYTFRED